MDERGRRFLFPEIVGSKLIPLTETTVKKALRRISSDPFKSGNEDYGLVRIKNPAILSLTSGISDGIIPVLYYEGLARTYAMFELQAAENKLVIPRISEVKAMAIATEIHDSNIEIMKEFDLSDMEELYSKISDLLCIKHDAFIDGITEMTMYSFWGESFGIGAFDLYRFMHKFLSGAPTQNWANLN